MNVPPSPYFSCTTAWASCQVRDYTILGRAALRCRHGAIRSTPRAPAHEPLPECDELPGPDSKQFRRKTRTFGKTDPELDALLDFLTGKTPQGRQIGDRSGIAPGRSAVPPSSGVIGTPTARESPAESKGTDPPFQSGPMRSGEWLNLTTVEQRID
jgi:hypothetical protein